MFKHFAWISLNMCTIVLFVLFILLHGDPNCCPGSVFMNGLASTWKFLLALYLAVLCHGNHKICLHATPWRIGSSEFAIRRCDKNTQQREQYRRNKTHHFRWVYVGFSDAQISMNNIEPALLRRDVRWPLLVCRWVSSVWEDQFNQCEYAFLIQDSSASITWSFKCEARTVHYLMRSKA